MRGYIRAMAADQIVVVKKLLKDGGAKGLACSMFQQ